MGRSKRSSRQGVDRSRPRTLRRVHSGFFAHRPARGFETQSSTNSGPSMRSSTLCKQQEHRTFLLHGVTGSGKTEVYIQAIREVASYGRQAIVLVPEISITPQTIERFRSRFDSVAVLHSHLSDAERYWHWRQIREGQVQVDRRCPQCGVRPRAAFGADHHR